MYGSKADRFGGWRYSHPIALFRLTGRWVVPALRRSGNVKTLDNRGLEVAYFFKDNCRAKFP